MAMQPIVLEGGYIIFGCFLPAVEREGYTVYIRLAYYEPLPGLGVCGLGKIEGLQMPMRSDADALHSRRRS